jgi:hypothetical protein
MPKFIAGAWWPTVHLVDKGWILSNTAATGRAEKSLTPKVENEELVFYKNGG